MQDLWNTLGDVVAHAYFGRAVSIVITWVVAWVLVRYLSRWVETLDDRVLGRDIDTRELQTLDRLLDYLIIVAAATISVSILGLTAALYSMLTAAGVIGIIIGFAVKDVAANFISGVFILIDQSFAVGDAIEVGDFSGAVKKISLRSTEIATWDGPVVIIPNSTLATTPVINYTVNPHRRIDLLLSIAYGEDVSKALETLQEVIEAEERRVEGKDINVYVSDVREYAIDIRAFFPVPNDDWFAVTKEIRQKALAEFRRHNIALAVPVRKTFYAGQVPPELGVE